MHDGKLLNDDNAKSIMPYLRLHYVPNDYPFESQRQWYTFEDALEMARGMNGWSMLFASANVTVTAIRGMSGAIAGRPRRWTSASSTYIMTPLGGMVDEESAHKCHECVYSGRARTADAAQGPEPLFHATP